MSELSLVCDSYDLIALEQVRDLPLSMRPTAGPGVTVRHLSLWLWGVEEAMERVGVEGEMMKVWGAKVVRAVALLWVGRLAQAKPSRWFLPTFRLHITGVIQLLRRHRPLPPHTEPIIDAALAWLILCLGILDAPYPLLLPFSPPLFAPPYRRDGRGRRWRRCWRRGVPERR